MAKCYKSKVKKIAKEEVGYQEKASNKDLDKKHANIGTNNYTKYGEAMGCNGEPWCDAFVDWCFVQAYGNKNAKKLLGGFSNYTPKSAENFKEMKQYYKSKPKVGDVIFFYSSSMERIAHTGIVYKVDKKYVYTIEGNTSSAETSFERDGGRVAYKKYLLTYDKIDGYGRPKYDVRESVTITTSCKLYKKPTITKGVFAKLAKGTIVVFYKDKGDGWSKVKYKKDIGYVKNTCLGKGGLSKYRTGVVTKNAALRKSNSIKSKKIITVSKGTKVKVVSTAKYWANCKVDKRDGFISMKKIKV